MNLEAVVLAVGLVAVLAAVLWLAFSLKAELRALSAGLHRLQTADPGSDAAAAKANPRLAAAQKAAAARTAKRAGRTTVKRI